jgi:hypothetical protein
MGDGLYRDEGDDSQGPARDFGFEFYASGPRTLKDTTLAMDTSDGWFTVHFPTVLLHVQKRAFEGHDPFQRDDYVSQKVYVQFPKAVRVNRAWVYSTGAEGDSYGWGTKDVVTCPPPPSASSQQSYSYHLHQTKPLLIPAAGDSHLEAAPTVGDTIVVPDASKPLENKQCADPFDEPEARVALRADYTVMSAYTRAVSTARIEVALDKAGNVLDAWTWQSSGSALEDKLAVQAARRSLFAAGRSYCQNVPSILLFGVEFGGYEGGFERTRSHQNVIDVR